MATGRVNTEVTERASANAWEAAELTRTKAVVEAAERTVFTRGEKRPVAEVLKEFDDLSRFQPPSAPVFEPKSEIVATVDHIATIDAVFTEATASLDLLRLHLFDPKEKPEDPPATFAARVAAFAKQYPDEVGGLLDETGRTALFKWELATTTAEAAASHVKLFDMGRRAVKDVTRFTSLRKRLRQLQGLKQDELERKKQELALLGETVIQARRALDALNRRRLEVLDDYAVRQRLVVEDWDAVERKFLERRKALEQFTGLFYVRARECAVGLELPDPLALRAGAAEDPVPGCDFSPRELDDALVPFMNTVLDVPATDWAILRPLYHRLPSPVRVELSMLQRQARLGLKKTAAAVPIPGVVGARLEGLRSENVELIGSLQKVTLSADASLVVRQKQAQATVSLEDLANGPPTLLSPVARALHDRLSGAASCLLDRLTEVRTSLRLAWARAAEAGLLDVERPELWPGLATAEADDFNRTRTLIEIVGWWFRQLSDDASPEGRAAMRNFVRACLLVAISDDPNQILHGVLRTDFRRLLLGQVVRLELNRSPLLGATLSLVDTNQMVIGALRVDDHDGAGAVATVVQVLKPDAPVASGMRVIGTVQNR